MPTPKVFWVLKKSPYLLPVRVSVSFCLKKKLDAGYPDSPKQRYVDACISQSMDTLDTKQLLHQATLSSITLDNFSTRDLLHQTPVTPHNCYNKHLLHQAPFTPETFYTRHLWHQTPLTPYTFYTRQFSRLRPRSLIWGIITLGNCDAGVCRAIKLLLSFSDSFLVPCPKHAACIRDLAFVPHVLKITSPWRHIDLESIRLSLHLGEWEWERCLTSPLSLDRTSARLKEVGQDLPDYRVPLQRLHWTLFA